MFVVMSLFFETRNYVEYMRLDTRRVAFRGQLLARMASSF
jgi:hypothetical protein